MTRARRGRTWTGRNDVEGRDALRLARGLVEQHGLKGWTVTFDRAVRRAGATHFADRRISLSRHLVALYSEEQVHDVVLHEIAHALVGPRAGHGPRWRAAVTSIGGSPRRTTAADAPTVPAPWLGLCPAGHRHERYQRPRSTYLCRRCPAPYRRRAVISWTNVSRAA